MIPNMRAHRARPSLLPEPEEWFPTPMLRAMTRMLTRRTPPPGPISRAPCRRLRRTKKPLKRTKYNELPRKPRGWARMAG